MIEKIDRAFGEQFLTSIDDFYAYGVDKLFNDWWATAPAEAISKYVEAIENHPEQAPIAREQWYADPLDLASLAQYEPLTLGHAYQDFMVSNDLMERLAQGYREFHEQLEALDKFNVMPPVLKYKVLRGFQTHDLHHVLTGYSATPFGELALQAFQLAQMDFPYSAMWIAVVTGRMALVDPLMIKPAMDAITDGRGLGRRARSIQFVKFESVLHRPITDILCAYRLNNHRDDTTPCRVNPLPELIHAH